MNNILTIYNNNILIIASNYQKDEFYEIYYVERKDIYFSSEDDISWIAQDYHQNNNTFEFYNTIDTPIKFYKKLPLKLFKKNKLNMFNLIFKVNQ